MNDTAMLPESAVSGQTDSVPAAPSGDAAVKEQKCPACGGSMRFDPEKGLLVCEFCGTTQKVQEEPYKAKGFDFDALNEKATDSSAAALPVYHCVSCGAELIAPPEQMALTCPYCSNNIVLTDKMSGNLRPDGIIPFRISARELPDALKRFYRGKALIPKRFFSESTMGKVTGVYVPFWVFSGSAGGDVSFSAETENRYTRGSYEITETSRYILERRVSLAFENLPVDASGRIDDKLMDSLEPFDMREEKPFDVGYLAGFTADRFDSPKKDVSARAKKRIFATAARAASASVGAPYRNVRQRGGDLRLNLTARYLLLPVYLFEIQYNGKSWPFAVNGQSGEAVGELPIGKEESFLHFGVRAAAVVFVMMAAFLAKYLGGG